MPEWTVETRKTLLEVAIEAVGEQVRSGAAEADIEYEDGAVRVTLRREPFWAEPQKDDA